MNQRSEFVYSERFFLSVGLTLASFLMSLAGVNYLDSVYGFMGIDQDTYNLARLFICLLLGLCAGISISKGLLAGSILMLVISVSCGSYIMSYFMGVEPSSLQDPFLSLMIFLVGAFFYKRGDRYLAVATWMFGLSLLLPLFLEGDAVDVVLGVGLFVGGALFATYGSAIIVEGETGMIRIKMGSVFRHKSIRGMGVNPYEIGVPICSVFAGMLMAFISLFHIYDGASFSAGDFIAISMFTLVLSIMAFYLGLRNVLAEGLFYLLLSLELIVQLVPMILQLEPIPFQMYFLMLLPTLFISVLCYRKGDIIFGTAIILNFMCLMLSNLGGEVLSDGLAIYLCGILELVMGALFLYHGISRWMLIATRREVLPLFSGNLVRTEVDITTDSRKVRTRREWNITPLAIHLGHVLTAILLIWVAVYYLNNVYEVVHIDPMAYTVSKLIIGCLVAIMTVFSIGRGAVTESVVFLLTGLSCLDYAVLEILGREGMTLADFAIGMVLLLSGAFYFVRRCFFLGLACTLYAVSISAPYLAGDITGDVVLGFLMLASGVLLGAGSVWSFIQTIFGREDTAVADRTTGQNGLTTGTYETLVTLGYIALSVELLLQFVNPYSAECDLYIMIHSFVVVAMGLYGIGRTYVAEGFALLIPGLLMLMNSSCEFVFDESLPLMFYVLMSIMMLPCVTVFHINKDRMNMLINLLLLMSFLLWGFSGESVAILLVLVAAVLIDYNSINNWCIVELRRKILPTFR